jgi:pilus assembly protein CpaB
MTRGRRALVLALLATVLGGMAAADVTGRERALRDQLGPVVPVLVTRGPVRAGAPLRAQSLAVRHVPSRYAPAGAYGAPSEVAGLLARGDLAAGTDLVPALTDDGRRDPAAVGAPVRPGERVAELVARGSPALVTPGVRVDVLVTRETADGAGSTLVALEDAEVLAATPAAGERAGDDGGPRVAVSLRTSLRQAVYLAAAQDFARDVRVLPRAAGDRRRGASGMRVGSGLPAEGAAR